jgi:excisionase family DNA binding protein
VDRGGQLPADARGGPDNDGVSPLLDIAEVRYRLNVSEKTVRRLVADGELVAVRVGALVRFDPLDVARFLTRARTDADKPEAAA